MAFGKRGRPAKNDPNGNVFNPSPLQIRLTLTPKKYGPTGIVKDDLGNIALFEGKVDYFNQWGGEDGEGGWETSEYGVRVPVFDLPFAIEYEDGTTETKTIHIDVREHLALEISMQKMKAKDASRKAK